MNSIWTESSERVVEPQCTRDRACARAPPKYRFFCRFPRERGFVRCGHLVLFYDKTFSFDVITCKWIGTLRTGVVDWALAAITSSSCWSSWVCRAIKPQIVSQMLALRGFGTRLSRSWRHGSIRQTDISSCFVQPCNVYVCIYENDFLLKDRNIRHPSATLE